MSKYSKSDSTQGCKDKTTIKKNVLQYKWRMHQVMTLMSLITDKTKMALEKIVR